MNGMDIEEKQKPSSPTLNTISRMVFKKKQQREDETLKETMWNGIKAQRFVIAIQNGEKN